MKQYKNQVEKRDTITQTTVREAPAHTMMHVITTYRGWNIGLTQNPKIKY